jgi:hypothetical protein
MENGKWKTENLESHPQQINPNLRIVLLPSAPAACQFIV